MEIKVEGSSTVTSVVPEVVAVADPVDSANTGEPMMVRDTDTAASHRPQWENQRHEATENQHQNDVGQRDAQYNVEGELPTPLQDATRHFAGYSDSSLQPSGNGGDFQQYRNMQN